MSEQTFPLSLVDVPPGEGATRFTGVRLDGSPDGVHTGGVWFMGEEAWKPTDCLPNPGCDYRVLTGELEALTALAGQPLFPKNWEYRERNGRGWIVRPISYVFGQSDLVKLDTEQLAEVKAGLQNANRLGWEVGDDIAIALDPNDYSLFVVDMSAATKCTVSDGWTAGAANDETRFYSFARRLGFDLICDRRLASYEALLRAYRELDVTYEPDHCYGSYWRPVSRLWASRLPSDAILLDDRRSEVIPHTWVFTSGPIDPAVVASYELTLCNSPWCKN